MPLTLKNFYKQGWQPGANTLFYFEFENNLNDSSGKGNNATGSSGIGYEQIGGEYVAKTTTGSSPYITLNPAVGRNIGSGDFTISFWLYPKSTSGTPMVFGTFADVSPYYGPTIFYNYNATNKICFRLRGNNEYYTDAVAVNTRHYLVFTRINGVCYAYVDNVKKLEFSDNSSWTGATTTYLLSRPTSNQGFSNAGVMMDKFIYEDQGRDVSEIGDYYDQTKSLYGIGGAKGGNSTPEEEKKEEKQEKEQVIILNQVDNGSGTGDALKL